MKIGIPGAITPQRGLAELETMLETIHNERIRVYSLSYISKHISKPCFVELNKTYRSTSQIVEFYNKIGKKSNVNYVNRSGDAVEFIKTNEKDEISTILSLIDDFKTKGFRSIAIITKTNIQALDLSKKFENKNININLIDDNVDKYDNEVCIISIYNSKGLEFDGVIVYNVDDSYSSELDRNLLYIACTRALHKLTLTCNSQEFSKLIQN